MSDNAQHCGYDGEPQQLMCIPKHSPVSKKDYYLCTMDAFDRLMGDVANACAFGDKQDKEVKRCERRKHLLDCWV